MGSTIIVLLAKNKAEWDSNFTAEKVVKLGEHIGKTLA
jgi:phosphatidylserine decarboxylase